MTNPFFFSEHKRHQNFIKIIAVFGLIFWGLELFRDGGIFMIIVVKEKDLYLFHFQGEKQEKEFSA